MPLWRNGYDGPANDYVSGVAAGPSGNIYVTGYSSGQSSSLDYLTLAFSSAGVPLWTSRYNGPSNGDDRATAVAVDAGGNVFVAGYSTRTGADGQRWLTKWLTV